jgi:hypothetical protein
MPDLADLVGQWHEFYILLGTAAAGQVSDLSAKAAISTPTAYRLEQHHQLPSSGKQVRGDAVAIRSPSSSMPRSCRC